MMSFMQTVMYWRWNVDIELIQLDAFKTIWYNNDEKATYSSLPAATQPWKVDVSECRSNRRFSLQGSLKNFSATWNNVDI